MTGVNGGSFSVSLLHSLVKGSFFYRFWGRLCLKLLCLVVPWFQEWQDPSCLRLVFLDVLCLQATSSVSVFRHTPQRCSCCSVCSCVETLSGRWLWVFQVSSFPVLYPSVLVAWSTSCILATVVLRCLSARSCQPAFLLLPLRAASSLLSISKPVTRREFMYARPALVHRIGEARQSRTNELGNVDVAADAVFVHPLSFHRSPFPKPDSEFL